MSLAASPCVGQASGRQLCVRGEFCICIARGWPPFNGGEGVSFSRLCCKFAQKTEGSHQVRVQLTLQPLRPESGWRIPARAVMPELWDQLSLTFQSGLCLPPTHHDPREQGEATGGTQTRLLQKTREQAHTAAPCSDQHDAESTVDGGIHHGESRGCDRDGVLSPDPPPFAGPPTAAFAC